MKPTIEIGGRTIGPGHPVYVIAEISGNHNQDFDQAVHIIRAAKAAGADAVKLQTYTADTLTLDCDAEVFQIGKGTVWEGRNLHQLYSEAYTPWEWQPRLKVVAQELGMALFSSPFDDTAVDFLENMNVPAYKIASFEIVDLPLIERVARTGKPVIISTGMATLEEITEAVECVRMTGNQQLALLKCTSAYPAPPEEMHLSTIGDMARRFEVPIGLSDHTLESIVAVTSMCLGACLIEKHLTLSREVPGPDSSFSLEPNEFAAMVRELRMAESARGEIRYEISAREEASRIFRRSLFVVRDVRAGDVFTRENLRSIRPANGLQPKFLPKILGKRAAVDIKRGTPLDLTAVSDT